MRLLNRLNVLAVGFVLACVMGNASADDAPAVSNPKYAAIPNLTNDQKAKIAAIEKQTDQQVMEILTADQRAAMQSPAMPLAGRGLYGGEAAAMTAGAIKSRDYWESKFNADQLEQAIKDHQPEGAIGMQLISSLNLLNDLIKQYPKHQELIAWHDREIAVQKQIGDNFDRNGVFKPGCLWNQDSYMQSYVGYHTAKTAMDDNDAELAFSMAGLALQKVNYLTESDDHMSDYPAEAKEWIRKIKPELQQIHDSTAKKTHHM